MATERYSRYLIRTARRQAGLTQQALATRAATSQAAVSAYESGRRSPSVDTLARILDAAGFELRMRLARPDTHDATRQKAENLFPREAVEAFTGAERERVGRVLASGSDSRRHRESVLRRMAEEVESSGLEY